MYNMLRTGIQGNIERGKVEFCAQYAIAPSYLKCKLAPLVRD